MSSDEEERSLNKQIFKNPIEVQKARLDRLMNNMEKPVFIPEKKEIKPPRAFQPHEFVRNVMGASAGAGSGEFDIYRGCRRRQMIREAYLNRQAKEQEANAQWQAKVESSRERFATQAEKKRQKRLKRKGKPKKKKPEGNQNSKKTDESSSSSDDEESEEETKEVEAETPATNGEQSVPKNDEPAVESPPSPETTTAPREKGDIRQHLRVRKESSSDDDANHKGEKQENSN